MAVNLQRPQAQRESERCEKINPAEPLPQHAGPGSHREHPDYLHEPDEPQQQEPHPQDIEGRPVTNLRMSRGMVSQESFAIPAQGDETDPGAQGKLSQHPEEGYNADDLQVLLQNPGPHWID